MKMRRINILMSGAIFVMVNGMPEPEAGLGVDQINTLSRVKRGGACESTTDCVSGNVCSKWGWCQWTTIYGKDGPSQGASAPSGGKAGQCVTTADCGSRVPYCSKLGFCHGGRLPFDEAQIEIPDEDKTNPFPDQPQGFINNNPPKNSPLINGKSGGAGKTSENKSSSQAAEVPRRQGSPSRKTKKPKPNKRPATRTGSTRKTGGSSSRSPARGGSSKSGACPGGNVEACVGACEAIDQLKAYTACVKQCGKRC
eukprot:TRINITY_DN13841_c0_g1_i1.p1 TRINITY_DN13841_c0_g1~~TRINITY_DN13841_c0_g1_i1.p1  ORF type:complete len:254 (-),score=59.96 TRINITY_DN13841_c0_g1_i1:84-845(-)